MARSLPRDTSTVQQPERSWRNLKREVGRELQKVVPPGRAFKVTLAEREEDSLWFDVEVRFARQTAPACEYCGVAPALTLDALQREMLMVRHEVIKAIRPLGAWRVSDRLNLEEREEPAGGWLLAMRWHASAWTPSAGVRHG